MMKTTTFLKQTLLFGLFVCFSTLWGQNDVYWNANNATATSSPSSSHFTVGSITQNNTNGAVTMITNSSVSSGYTFTLNGTSGTAASGTNNFGVAAKTGVLNTASSGSAYFEVTITPDSGYTLNITAVNFASRSTGTGPANYSIQTNASGSYAEVATGALSTAGTWTNQYKTNSVSVTSSNAITVRVYGYAGTGSPSAGTANWRIDDVVVTATAVLPIPTWDGTQWVGGMPSVSTNAIINGDYSGASFTAANLTVNATRTLTIINGNTVTATNVTNNGSIVVENGGNFIQATGGTYANSGNFTVNKNTTSAINKYVFWASPTASQNMFGIHTTTPQYVMTYNSDTDYYNTLANPATSVSGVGYSVKMPVASAIATFGGTSAQPNNGDVTVTLNNTSTNKYNLIGNPYPSNLNLNTFYNNGSNNVGSTFWFWDNTSNNVTTQTGNTTTNVGYATYNAAGSGTWAEAPSSSASHSGNAAAIGQGFIVEATGATATFTNAMRVSTSGNTFNKLNGNDTGKFWLKLATPYGSHTMLAVNYEGGALNGYDKYDSNAMGVGSDAFYSTIGAEKLVIQGKSPFTVDDVVPLGNKHFEAGNFVISLTQKEGLFNNGQAIYLHDKDLGTYTNLQNGNYSFSANAGEFTNRFEIVYKLGVLATQEIEKTTFEVYRDGEGFVARNNKNIDVLEIFDASGRKIIELKPNASSAKFKLEAKGMYILRAISAGKEYTKKLIK